MLAWGLVLLATRRAVLWILRIAQVRAILIPIRIWRYTRRLFFSDAAFR